MVQPNGWVAAFGYAVLGSSIIPLPVDSTIPGLVAIAPNHWRRLTAALAVGSMIGGLFTYFFGFFLSHLAFDHMIVGIHTSSAMDNAMHWMNGTSGKLYLIFVSVIAGPYRLTTLAAGITKMSFASFLVIIVFGRLARFSLIALAAHRFGIRSLTKKYRLILAAVYALVIGVLSIVISSLLI